MAPFSFASNRAFAASSTQIRFIVETNDLNEMARAIRNSGGESLRKMNFVEALKFSLRYQSSRFVGASLSSSISTVTE